MDLKALSAAARGGEWLVDEWEAHDEDGGPSEILTEGVMVLDRQDEPDLFIRCGAAEAQFVAALVNAYRTGRLVEADPAPQAT